MTFDAGGRAHNGPGDGGGQFARTRHTESDWDPGAWLEPAPSPHDWSVDETLRYAAGIDDRVRFLNGCGLFIPITAPVPADLARCQKCATFFDPARDWHHCAAVRLVDEHGITPDVASRCASIGITTPEGVAEIAPVLDVEPNERHIGALTTLGVPVDEMIEFNFRNSFLPAWIAARVPAGLDTPDDALATQLADDPVTEPFVLEHLAGHRNPAVRSRVAQHERTPARALRQMAARDPNPDVRRLAAAAWKLLAAMTPFQWDGR